MFVPSLSLPAGITSLADVERWDPNAKEEAAEALLRSHAQIDADCTDEALTGVARAAWLAAKGAPAQRWAALDALQPLLQTDGAAAFDALFPPLQRQLVAWAAPLQAHAAGVYAALLRQARAVGLEAARRQRDEAAGSLLLYDTPTGAPPPLPWAPDHARIEHTLLPTILLLADAEPGAITLTPAAAASTVSASAGTAARAAASASSSSLADSRTPGSGGGDTQEEAASAWLEPLELAVDLLCVDIGGDADAPGATCNPGRPGGVLERVAAFAIHKRDPTGSTSSRVAAARVIGFLAPHMPPQQLHESVLFFSLRLPLRGDQNCCSGVGSWMLARA